jgi:hypothetical protein
MLVDPKLMRQCKFPLVDLVPRYPGSLGVVRWGWLNKLEMSIVYDEGAAGEVMGLWRSFN